MFFWVILFIIIIGGPALVHEVFKSDGLASSIVAARKAKAIEKKTAKKAVTGSGENYNHLSWPAKQVMHKFNTIPTSSRPDINMYELLKALDVKHGKEKVNSHLIIGERRVIRRGNGGGYPEWTKTYGWDDHQDRYNYSCHYKKSCVASEYYRFWCDLLGIEKALAEREQALKLEGVAHHLDAIEDAHARMKQEADIIKSVTAENVRRELN